MDDNWVMLSFISCASLILKYLLVGGMATNEVGPSHFQYIQQCIMLKSSYTLLLDEITRNLYPSKYSMVVNVM